MTESGANPDHVRGLCDIADCEGVACHALRDDETGMYVEVCDEHLSSLGGFDSEYDRVEHDSPHREPERVEAHACGGELRVYGIGEDGDAEHHVCVDCGYALLLRETGERRMRVRESPPSDEDGQERA